MVVLISENFEHFDYLLPIHNRSCEWFLLLIFGIYTRTLACVLSILRLVDDNLLQKLRDDASGIFHFSLSEYRSVPLRQKDPLNKLIQFSSCEILTVYGPRPPILTTSFANLLLFPLRFGLQ